MMFGHRVVFTEPRVCYRLSPITPCSFDMLNTMTVRRRSICGGDEAMRCCSGEAEAGRSGNHSEVVQLNGAAEAIQAG